MKVVDSLSCLKHATAARLRFCPDDCTSRVQSSKSGMRATPLLLSTKERDERASLHSSRVTPESATTSSSGRKVCCKTLCAALGRRLTCGRAEMMTAQAARSGASVFSVSAIWTSLTNRNPCRDSVGDTKTDRDLFFPLTPLKQRRAVMHASMRCASQRSYRLPPNPG